MVDQETLRRLLADRMEACRKVLPTAQSAADDIVANVDTGVFVVVGGFDPAEFVRGALEFALGLPIVAASGWMRAFTRAVFLAGNPANLTARFAFQHVTADGSIGWIGPVDMGLHTGLRRLLRSFQATAPLRLPPRLEVEVPGAPPTGVTYDLFVRTARSVPQYLVDVHHTVAEAAVRGVLSPGDRLRMRHVPDLDAVGGVPRYARILPDRYQPALLSPLTWLVPAEPVQEEAA